jgi:hypothetical protein
MMVDEDIPRLDGLFVLLIKLAKEQVYYILPHFHSHIHLQPHAQVQDIAASSSLNTDILLKEETGGEHRYFARDQDRDGTDTANAMAWSCFSVLPQKKIHGWRLAAG